LNFFSTELTKGQKRKKVYLPTSPELHLKKALALGYGPLFEIKNCFRNDEISEHHEPEFTMLEWYRPFSDLSAIAEDAEKLLQFVSGQPRLKLKKTSMPELFREHLQFELQANTGVQELAQLAQKVGVKLSASEPIDDVFNRLFIERIEPKLPADQPLLVQDFPPYLAAYSRLTEKGWADRFEIYWQGMELANAFHELNDPVLQEQRMREDLQKKSSLGKPTPDLDEEFLQALRFGLPPSGGIALGVERLFMALTQRKTIQECKVFPYSRLF
jgi:lysyl-tRNA synthetase class 2